MTRFTHRMRPLVDTEIRLALDAEARGQFDTALRHLEHAHVLGQRSTVLHVRVHWQMARMALRNGWAAEAWGQLWRLPAAALFTPFGLVPAGNPGSARVSGFRAMPVATGVAATLAALLAGCMTPPESLDLSRDKLSQDGRYRVALTAPSPAPAVNQLHAWRVQVSSPEGQPVTGARFTVTGGMPQHGHGFPTQPRVTRELGDGSYLLEGMKFSMTGWWDLRLGIEGERGADRATFNIVVDPKADGR